MTEVKIVNTSGLDLPQYSTEHSAGMDVRAAIDMPVTIMPGERKLIPTGLRVQLPDGYELQMRPRSGLALKRGVTLLNSPGTIDADFRGEIGVIIINHSDEPFIIERGDRIAQMVLARYERICWYATDSLDESERGDGGFGHSGVK
ncbi:MAG: dUTP diphosphatase [Muribaculaceae bacterium]|jgi:dUTP pyrophosphatase|nr:dUTP diphosphatase [Muribaculaceae bacterium]